VGEEHLEHEGHERTRNTAKNFVPFAPFREFRGPTPIFALMSWEPNVMALSRSGTDPQKVAQGFSAASLDALQEAWPAFQRDPTAS